ncbi:MAG: FtsW/RodA/SpoVE family cell cycle protein [Candidatus Pristimantibacillus sp.]
MPYIYSDMLFTYLVYSLGWVAGVAIATVVLMLAGRIAGIVTKLHDPYAKNLVIGLFSIIGVKFLWSIAMSVGLLPMTSMRLPFIGYGGTSTILEMAAIGVILSVYRRKDMIPRQAASTQS